MTYQVSKLIAINTRILIYLEIFLIKFSMDFGIDEENINMDFLDRLTTTMI